MKTFKASGGGVRGGVGGRGGMVGEPIVDESVIIFKSAKTINIKCFICYN